MAHIPFFEKADESASCARPVSESRHIKMAITAIFFIPTASIGIERLFGENIHML
jgi:hypothetical protein